MLAEGGREKSAVLKMGKIAVVLNLVWLKLPCCTEIRVVVEGKNALMYKILL